VRRTSLAAIGYAAALIPLVGCGGDSTSTADGGQGSGGDASAVEPCSLVSDDEMAGILEAQLPDEGAITVTSQSAPLDVGGTCTYTWSGTASTGKEFTISLFPAENLDISAGSGERTAIDGVGDEAFESGDNYYARVGDLAIHLVNLQEGHEASVEVLTAAAEGL
jgi:hypothetical protein